MKKISLIFICIMMVAILLAGCGKKTEEVVIKENDPAVVGTWSEDFFHSGFIFNSDDTGRDTFWDLTFTYTALDGVITITYDSDMYGIVKYDYSISGDTITMTRQDDKSEAFEYKKQASASRPATPAALATEETQGSPETDENGETIESGEADDTEETTEED